MPWNYRVVKVKEKNEGFILTEVEYYTIYEVYYEEGSMEINGWAEYADIGLASEDIEGIQDELEKLKEATKKPVLEFKEGKLVEREGSGEE